MYTVDASIWVNAFDQREPGHEASRQLLVLLGSRGVPIVVPTLLLVEVAGAISRTRRDPAQAQAFAQILADPSHIRLVPLDAPLAFRALALAAQRGLRGADAVYAAVALQNGCILVTRDREQLTRLADVVPVQTPEALLTVLTSAEPKPPPDSPPADAREPAQAP